MRINDISAADRERAARREREHGRAGASVVAAPFSNTGRKIEENQPVLGVETTTACEASTFDASERIELIARGDRLALMRHPLPNEVGTTNGALIDWLAFTVKPSDRAAHEWVIRELQRLGVVNAIEELAGGYAGYACKAHWSEGKTRLCLVAWGGKNQRDTVYVSLTGHGCARIKEWSPLVDWLEQHAAVITRLDLV